MSKLLSQRLYNFLLKINPLILGHPEGERCSFCGVRTDRLGYKHMQGAWYWWNGGVEVFHSSDKPPRIPVSSDKLISVQVRFPKDVQYCHRCMIRQVKKVLQKGSGKYIGNKMVREER